MNPILEKKYEVPGHYNWDPVPRYVYTSPDFVKTEWENMWTKTWTIACRESQCPNPGDYYIHEFGPESLIVIRGQDLKLRCFYNVCPHRGNMIICDKQMGNVKALRCGYHNWLWDRDGKVRNIPDEETFCPRLDKSKLGLSEVRTESWGGWLWICLDKNTPNLKEYLGEIADHLRAYDLEKLSLISNNSVEWHCNWKNAIDAFCEAYHVQALHPQLMEWQDDYSCQLDCIGDHGRLILPFGRPAKSLVEKGKMNPALNQMVESVGLNPNDFEGRLEQIRPAIQQAKRKIQNDTHYPYKNLADYQLSDVVLYTVFPNLNFNMYAESLMLFLIRPHPTRADRCYFDMQMYTHLKPGETVAPQHMEKFLHGQVSLGELVDADAYNLPRVQEGMASRAYTSMPLSRQELLILHRYQVLMNYVKEGYGGYGEA